jgi:hypothetical protein
LLTPYKNRALRGVLSKKLNDTVAGSFFSDDTTR